MVIKRDNRDLIGYCYGPDQGPHIKCEVVGVRENDQVLICRGRHHYALPAAVVWGIKDSHAAGEKGETKEDYLPELPDRSSSSRAASAASASSTQ